MFRKYIRASGNTFCAKSCSVRKSLEELAVLFVGITCFGVPWGFFVGGREHFWKWASFAPGKERHSMDGHSVCLLLTVPIKVAASKKKRISDLMGVFHSLWFSWIGATRSDIGSREHLVPRVSIRWNTPGCDGDQVALCRLTALSGSVLQPRSLHLPYKFLVTTLRVNKYPLQRSK